MNRFKRLQGIARSGYRLVTIFMFLFSVGRAGAQGICDYLDQSLNRVVQRIQLIREDYDCAPGTCLLGAYLSEGGSQRLSTRLSADQEYLIIGAGDEDIRDLDLVCTDIDRNVIVCGDTEDDPFPVLRFTPRHTGPYLIEMTSYDANDDGFCVFLILKRSDSSHFPLFQFTEALDKAIIGAKSLCQRSHFVPGGICLFGGKAAQGGESSLSNIRLEGGRYACRGSCSGNISDLDLYVIRQEDETTIARDIDPDNTPLCNFYCRSNTNYLLKTSVADADARAGGFVFTLLMKY